MFSIITNMLQKTNQVKNKISYVLLYSTKKKNNNNDYRHGNSFVTAD